MHLEWLSIIYYQIIRFFIPRKTGNVKKGFLHQLDLLLSACKPSFKVLQNTLHKFSTIEDKTNFLKFPHFQQCKNYLFSFGSLHTADAFSTDFMNALHTVWQAKAVDFLWNEAGNKLWAMWHKVPSRFLKESLRMQMGHKLWTKSAKNSYKKCVTITITHSILYTQETRMKRN